MFSFRARGCHSFGCAVAEVIHEARKGAIQPGIELLGLIGRTGSLLGLCGGKRQGLGVATLANGEFQSGDWSDDRLNGLGTVRLPDETRYTGQWRDGQSTGLGVREKPGAERAEGNFVGGLLEGFAVRRTLVDPNIVQAGEFHGDVLDGPGVERVGERAKYEGGFRNGLRNGFGQLTDGDGKVLSGRWSDGKVVESAP